MAGRGFEVRPEVGRLRGTYPCQAKLREAIEAGRQDRAIVARLWVAEGIPYAFRKCPALYEEIRSWLADGLDVDAKEISIAGSGRTGYSLRQKIGAGVSTPPSLTWTFSRCLVICSKG